MTTALLSMTSPPCRCRRSRSPFRAVSSLTAWHGLASWAPCLVLVEVAEVFAWAHDRRMARHGSLQFPGLTDEEVAEYGLRPLEEDAPADARP